MLMMLFSGFLISQIPQEKISDLKTSSSEIKGRMLNSIYQQDKQQLENIIGVLNLDVFEYYNLKNQYNTDSKREEYMNSEDYKTQYSKLKELRDQMISGTFHLDFEPDYQAERSIGLIHNTKGKSFSVSNDVSLSIFYNGPELFQLDQILLKYPSGMTLNKRNVNYACVDVIEETISFEINDDALVSKIQESKKSLRLLFVFNITGTLSTQGKTSNLTYSDYSIMTDLHKVVAYNSNTNEIYATYK